MAIYAGVLVGVGVLVSLILWRARKEGEVDASVVTVVFMIVGVAVAVGDCAVTGWIILHPDTGP